MPVTVYIPTPFRRFAGNQSYLKAEGHTSVRCWTDSGTSTRAAADDLRQRDEIPGT